MKDLVKKQKEKYKAIISYELKAKDLVILSVWFITDVSFKISLWY